MEDEQEEKVHPILQIIGLIIESLAFWM